jgi:DNA polymerase-3 subunit epsilon
MENFKLKTVAQEMGIEVDESKLHDAKYDLELTYQIYQKIV